VKQTTVYLPDDLKKRLDLAARQDAVVFDGSRERRHLQQFESLSTEADRGSSDFLD